MSTMPGTERANDAIGSLDAMGTREMLELINREDAGVSLAVEREIPAIAQAVDALAERLRAGGRLVLIGAGTSGRLALMQAAEARPTFGIAPGTVIGIMAGGPNAMVRPTEAAEDDFAGGEKELRRVAVDERDGVVGISASGRTRFVLGALAEARRSGALAVALACDHPAPVGEAADIAIHPLVGPEVVAGSTRLKAGTAQKLVLDMITTAVMVRLGMVHGNLMVGVQGTNDKLRRRARGIVEHVTGRSDQAVEDALVAAEWSTRHAIVMLVRGVDAAEARRLIESGRTFAELIAGDAEGGTSG